MQYGELLAILGANGSGKSTTCHILCGITPATSGDVLINDQSSLLEQRHGGGLIGWCPQHDILFDDLTPVEHVGSPLKHLMVDFIIQCYLWDDSR
jgi:ABC-type multidrug transport system ATPase subunit